MLSLKNEKEKEINELCAYFIFGWLEGAKKKLKADNSAFISLYLQMSEERRNLRFFCARTVPIKASTLKKQSERGLWSASVPLRRLLLFQRRGS